MPLFPTTPRFACQRCSQHLARRQYASVTYPRWAALQTVARWPSKQEKREKSLKRKGLQSKLHAVENSNNSVSTLEESTRSTHQRRSWPRQRTLVFHNSAQPEGSPNSSLEESKRGTHQRPSAEPTKLAPAGINPVGKMAQHFNWYWETFPPTLQQLSHANTFFMKDTKPPRRLCSAAHFRLVPDSDVPEVAFVGRSNVGKSSLLNAVVDANGKELVARTSATRGFTRTMNFYGIGTGTGITVEKDTKGRDRIVGQGGLVMVDMPGYGEGSLTSWGVEIMKYIQSRKQLRRVFVLLDAEHGIKDKDRALLASLRLAGVSHQVILSKMDKLYVPEAKSIKHSDQKKGFLLKPKGTRETLQEAMKKLKPDIKPPVGGGALGEVLACSAEIMVGGRRLGIDHVRYAVLKAVGLDNASVRRLRLFKHKVGSGKKRRIS